MFVVALAAAVVCCTAYALILPAITLADPSAEDTKTTTTVQNVSSDADSKEDIVITEDDLGGDDTDAQSDDDGDDEQIISFSDSANMPVVLSADDIDKDIDPDTGALNIHDYIDSVTLSYKKSGSDTWIEYYPEAESNDPLPGDISVKVEVDFNNVPIQELIDANGKMEYILPTVLRNVKGSSNIVFTDDDGVTTVIGKMTADGSDTVSLQYDVDWLKEHINDEYIHNSFFVAADLNLSVIGEDSKEVINFGGNINIELDFEDNLLANYATLNVKKTVASRIEQTSEGDFLVYTIDVTTGQDGCPDVQLVDQIKNTTYIEEYVGITSTATTLSSTASGNGPTETITTTHSGSETGSASRVYLANATTDGSIPAAGDSVTTKPGVMVWDIGTMKPYEERILTYRVKLTEGYTGGPAKSDGKIENVVQPYAEQQERTSANSIFTPKSTYGTQGKKCSTPTTDDDGYIYVTYYVYEQTNANNSYNWDNIKLQDGLKLDSNPNNWTNSEYLPYISFVEDSFHLYKFTDAQKNNATNVSSLEELSMDNANLTFDESTKSFSIHVGDIEPGNGVTVSYQLKISPQLFTLSSMSGTNSYANIVNRVIISGDDTRTDTVNWTPDKFSNRDLRLYSKVWERKIMPEKVTEDTTISMNANSVYEYNGSTTTKSTSAPSSFTVAASDYRYQVVVNETGDWDVSSSQLCDTLQASSDGVVHMQYAGYVQIDAYELNDDEDYTSSNNVSEENNEAIIAELTSKTPAKTAWVKVDGLKSFNFSPKDAGLDGDYAYVLTYYTQPVDMEGLGNAYVSNNFKLSGTVGIGGSYWTLSGSSMSVSAMITDSSNFEASKMSWYYEDGQTGLEEGDDWYNGSIYWIMKLDGNYIPENVSLKDVPASGTASEQNGNTTKTGSTTNLLHDDSFVTVYRGKLGESIKDVESVSALSKTDGLKKVPESAYTVTTKDDSGNDTFIITFNEKIDLDEDESVYVILKTEPGSVTNGLTQLPQTKRGYRSYMNEMQIQFGNNGWLDDGDTKSAEYDITKTDKVFKELNKVFTYDKSTGTRTNIKYSSDGGKTYTNTYQDTDGNTAKENDLWGYDWNKKSGVLVGWALHFNYRGDMSGNYRVVETIPEGMEFISVCKVTFNGSEVSKKVGTTTIDGLSSDWKRTTSSGETIYVNEKENKVMMMLTNITSDATGVDANGCEFQIVCRVTDPDILTGDLTFADGTEKTLTNKVELYQDDELIDSDTDSIAMESQSSMSKESLWTSGDENNHPFKITVNPLAEDLVPGSDTITLVDELSDSLELDASTIQVVNSKTNAEVDVTTRVDGNILYITMPDNQPLTVTYTATVNAAPDTPVAISNVAHWEGYAELETSKVVNSSFSYSLGASATLNPRIQITKTDQYNVSKLLEGAEYEIQSGTMSEDGTFTADSTDPKTATTNAKGTANITNLSRNTVYRIKEVTAPSGYNLNEEPKYVYFAQKVDGAYQTDGLPDNVTIVYTSVYKDSEYDNRGVLTATKYFQDADGKAIDDGVDGIYRFGVYDNAEGTGDPLDIQTIVYGKGTKTPADGIAKFGTLNTAGTYYIYELDDKNQPVKDGETAYINQVSVKVTYGENGNEVVLGGEEGDPVNVDVTNQSVGYVLPKTGGIGIIPYLLGGLLVLTGGLIYGYKMRRKLGGV
jgi:LPXTG-motif cell wall-anchored protein